MITTKTTSTTPLHIDPPAQLQRELLDAQRAAYLAEGPPSAEVRLDRIDRFVACVLEYAEEISEALRLDFGSRSRLVNLGTDVVGALPAIELVRNNIEEWMQDWEVPGSAESGTPTFVQVRPKGVVGVIGPWNFPVGLVVHPAIDALAAGNRVMIKFSDVPERTAEVFARAVASRMDPEEVVVVRGGIATASAFSALPFDHIIFTGSPNVGAIVGEAAAKNLVPVTLELGGKNPVVLGSDADLKLAAKRTASVRILNGGQICLCPDYVFVPRAQTDEFVDAYEQAIREIFPAYLDNPDAVSIINERNYDRVTALVADAAAKGARVITISPTGEEDALPDRARRRIPPTVLLDVTPAMKIATEEIFGPVLVVYPYDLLSEVISYINSQPSPLAAYWFGSDGHEFQEFLRKTTSGGVTRNDVAGHWGIEGAPSGGIGRSGMGAYTGKFGFDTFSHQRTVAANAQPHGSLAGLIPPAGAAEAEAVSMLIKQAYRVLQERLGEI